MNRLQNLFARRWPWAALVAAFAAATALAAALLLDIVEKKAEGRAPFVRLAEVGEDTTDPAAWGKNWPRQYDTYLLTAQPTRTRFGGHGGSEALPEERIERDPWLRRMFLGYAFSIDYRDRRGHAYMLEDQEQTQRLTKPQSGSCLHCHASVMPLYRALGGGDATAGFEKTYAMSYQEASGALHDIGHAFPVSCVDCHEPESMRLRVTRPGLIEGIGRLVAADGEVPALPSIERWRAGDRKEPYDINRDATRTEMRSLVCAQCHVEYYFKKEGDYLTFPWDKGTTVDDMERYYDEAKFSDWTHAISKAPMIKPVRIARRGMAALPKNGFLAGSVSD